MGTEMFNIDASWAEKYMKKRVSFLTAPTVVGGPLNNVKLSKFNTKIINFLTKST